MLFRSNNPAYDRPITLLLTVSDLTHGNPRFLLLTNSLRKTLNSHDITESRNTRNIVQSLRQATLNRMFYCKKIHSNRVLVSAVNADPAVDKRPSGVRSSQICQNASNGEQRVLQTRIHRRSAGWEHVADPPDETAVRPRVETPSPLTFSLKNTKIWSEYSNLCRLNDTINNRQEDNGKNTLKHTGPLSLTVFQAISHRKSQATCCSARNLPVTLVTAKSQIKIPFGIDG